MGLVAFKLFLAAAMSSCSITEGARECFLKLLLLIIKITEFISLVSIQGRGRARDLGIKKKGG